MAEVIIGTLSCVLCAIPFLTIGLLKKDGEEPISFWSGDDSLKAKLKDVKGYNSKMASLYIKYGIGFLCCGVAIIVKPVIGFGLLIVNCTFGIYVIYVCYKKILYKHLIEKS